MSTNRFPISRRTMLRGAGAALALPWLEAMAPQTLAAKASASTESPRRLAVLFMPNGVHPGQWTPKGMGKQFELSPTLEPLRELRDDLLVLTNLWNQNSDSGDGHYVKTSGFLTGTTIHKTVGVDLNSNGISLDQLLAKQIGQQTPLPSLELGTEPVRTGVDKAVGYTRVYGAHIAWRGPTSPLAREINPRSVFDRLMHAGTPNVKNARRDTAILDLVIEDGQNLRQRLGVSDRRKMDEYLHSVRSLEARLERASADRSSWAPRAAYDPSIRPRNMPEERPEEHEERVELLLDMIALAFQTDTTRVSTFMFGNSVSNINFSFLDGVRGAHHSLSHHQNEEDNLREYQLVNQWHVAQYARLLAKLKAMQEGEQSVLDNSLVLFGSGLRDGNAHDPHNLPILLGGHGGGRVATGQHLAYAKDTPLANLYVSMLDALGAPVDQFADSTGPLHGVLA
jgi:hypothetical protein